MTKKRIRIRIPWWNVPKHILMDLAESTGQDPTKARWYYNVETKEVEARPRIRGDP